MLGLQLFTTLKDQLEVGKSLRCLCPGHAGVHLSAHGVTAACEQFEAIAFSKCCVLGETLHFPSFLVIFLVLSPSPSPKPGI